MLKRTIFNGPYEKRVLSFPGENEKTGLKDWID